MSVVRCSGCTRRIGFSHAQYPMRNKVWCTIACAEDVPVTPDETRGAVMVELSREGWNDRQIGDLFGVGRSRAQQIVSARRS